MEPLFTREAREIFVWNDGERPRYSDPLAVELAILQAGRRRGLDFESEVARLAPRDDGTPPDPALTAEVMARVAPVFVEAIGLEPFDEATGAGWELADVVGLMTAYYRFRMTLKKTLGILQTTSASAAVIPPASPSITPPMSACS